MKVVKIILIALGVVFLILFAVGFVMGFTETKNNTTSTEPLFSEVDKAQFKTDFISSCDSGELNGAKFNQTTYCECALNNLLADYSYTVLAKHGLNDTPEQLQQLMQPYANKCLAAQGIEV